ncbi:MAG: hypothetical protein HC906_12210 [Bacteroidales bacterium]|nr:hypothetical protein [Bacteroidales bacterium]
MKLNKYRAEVRRDKNDEPLISENGNYIVDLYLKEIDDPHEFEVYLKIASRTCRNRFVPQYGG